MATCAKATSSCRGSRWSWRADRETARATTDSAGAFVLFVKQPGKCVLKVVYQDQTATLPVVLYNEPVRYRLALERKGSAFVLTRR